MINVLFSSREITPVERYLMTLSPKLHMIKDVPDGTIIQVDAFIEFEDVDDTTGDATNMISILSGKEGYVAQSATFKRSLKDINDCMQGQSFSIEKLSGETKAGRAYVNCALAI